MVGCGSFITSGLFSYKETVYNKFFVYWVAMDLIFQAFVSCMDCPGLICQFLLLKVT